MKYMPVTLTGTLPFFNGISIFLGVLLHRHLHGLVQGLQRQRGHDAVTPIVVFAAISAIVAGLLGAVLGWFNVVIMFPREVEKKY